MLLGIVIIESFAFVVLAWLCWRLWRACDAERRERSRRIRVRAGWLVIDGLHAASFAPGDEVGLGDGDETARVECVVGDTLVCSPGAKPITTDALGRSFRLTNVEPADPPPGEERWPREET